jgi:hypothetical protein
MQDVSPKDAADRTTTNLRGVWQRLRQAGMIGIKELVTKDLDQVAQLLPRRWRDALLQSSDPAEPIGPIVLDPMGFIHPAGDPAPSTEVAVEPKPVAVPLASTTLAFAVSVGRASLANRDSITIQAASVEVLLRDAIDRLKEVRPNSDRIAELESLRSVIAEFRQLLSGMPPADAIAGAKALCIRDGLVNWWNHEQLSITDRDFDMGLFAGALALCAQAGLIPPAKVASLIRGKHLRHALSEAVKSLASGN